MPAFHARVSPSGRLALESFPARGALESAPRGLGLLEVETLSVTRGDESLLSPSRTVLSQNGAVQIERGAVVERLVSSTAGVEQSWTFPEPPRGEGALRVEVAVGGPSFRAASSQGLHFSADPGVPGWRYGLATWVDADGTRTGLSPRYENGNIVLEVPAEVLKRSRYPATLDPVISPESALNAPLALPGGRHAAHPRSRNGRHEFPRRVAGHLWDPCGARDTHGAGARSRGPRPVALGPVLHEGRAEGGFQRRAVPRRLAGEAERQQQRRRHSGRAREPQRRAAGCHASHHLAPPAPASSCPRWRGTAPTSSSPGRTCAVATWTSMER